MSWKLEKQTLKATNLQAKEAINLTLSLSLSNTKLKKTKRRQQQQHSTQPNNNNHMQHKEEQQLSTTQDRKRK
jgi:hypothetical protein